jgi:anhydro-N-acetylmuramic acid kinase
MSKSPVYALGLMSGTSLDGLDLAYCRFDGHSGKWNFELLHTASLSYTDAMREKLAHTIQLSGEQLTLWHQEYGRWLGQQVKAFVDRHRLHPDLVASHGHTIFHQPDKGFTFQLGHGQALANACGQLVIADFRTLDVLLGGQGAPLVPIGDRHLFGAYDFCLNLGGIANISFEHQQQRIAFDICAINMLLNYLIAPLGKAYDENGELARSGQCDPSLLAALNAIPFFQQSPPKSLGAEWFSEYVQPIVDQSSLSVADKLCTAVHHIAHQIAASIEPFQEAGQQLLATGGGAFNTFFIEKLQAALGDAIEVVVPENKLIEFKEAIVFAFMGVLRLRNETNALRSVTGATKDTSSGIIFHPH